MGTAPICLWCRGEVGFAHAPGVCRAEYLELTRLVREAAPGAPSPSADASLQSAE